MALSSNFTQCAPETTKFGKITQKSAISPFKVTDCGTSRKLIFDFLTVINTKYLAPLRDIAFEISKIAFLAMPLAFKPPDGGVPLGRSPQMFSECQ